jgi:hypothetical protein
MTLAYHGSPNNFDSFNTNDVFLAKSEYEALSYGPNLYKVEFDSEPKWETPTIYVIKKEQVKNIVKL